MRGRRYGEKLGFPTANLDRRQFARLKVKPKLGVYAGVVQIAQIKNSLKKYKTGSYKTGSYKAGIVIGPMDRLGLPKLEAHLIGFSGSLYGRHLTIRLTNYLRPFRKYSGESALKAQIKKDISKVKRLVVLTRRLTSSLKMSREAAINN